MIHSTSRTITPRTIQVVVDMGSPCGSKLRLQAAPDVGARQGRSWGTIAHQLWPRRGFLGVGRSSLGLILVFNSSWASPFGGRNAACVRSFHHLKQFSGEETDGAGGSAGG